VATPHHLQTLDSGKKYSQSSDLLRRTEILPGIALASTRLCSLVHKVVRSVYRSCGRGAVVINNMTDDPQAP
jgi:hypothetical protein